MGVVTVEFGEGFFKDSTEYGLVSWGFGKNILPAIVFSFDWKPVVDNDSVGDAKGVKLYSIDAGRADLIVHVEEYLLHTAWYLGDCWSRWHEPAIADIALAQVLGRDSILSEEGVVRVNVFNSLPRNAMVCPSVCLILIGPS